MRSVFLAGLLLITLFLSSNPASAQIDSVRVVTKLVCTTQGIPIEPYLWTVKFSPQHLLVNGYYAELEKRFSATSNHSFTLSPQYYSGKTKTVDKLAGRESSYEEARVSGWGGQFMHRIYRSDPVKPDKMQYFSYGFNFHQFTVDYAVLGWGKVISDGIETYRYSWHTQQTEVERVGAIVMFGAQNPIFKTRFVTDIYGGIGIRSSGSNSALNHFDANILDYGSSGFYLAMGVKLGYSF